MNASARGFTTVAATVFSIVALLQLARAVSGIPIEINHWPLPVAASWGAAIVIGALAVWGWRVR